MRHVSLVKVTSAKFRHCLALEFQFVLFFSVGDYVFMALHPCVSFLPTVYLYTPPSYLDL